MRLEICIDANNVELLATFWQTALGYQRGTGDGEPWLNLVSPTSSGPVVFLQKVPEPKSVKDRLHLDLYVEDLRELNELIDRLIEVGGTRVGALGHGDGKWYQAMRDPEGNEFCVLTEKDSTAISG